MATRRATKTAQRQRPALRVLPGRGGRTARVAMIPAAVLVVLAIFAVAGLQAYLAQEGFRAARLERDLRHEEERFALLRAQAADLSSPARLASQAERLGMTQPANPVFLRAPGPVPDRPADDLRAPYETKRLLREARSWR